VLVGLTRIYSLDSDQHAQIVQQLG
jgi:hypothetical protein